MGAAVAAAAAVGVEVGGRVGGAGLYTDARLPPAAREAMITAHAPIWAELAPAAGYGWAIGMHTYLDNKGVIWKDGSGLGGSTFLGRFVEDDVTLIVLSNNSLDWRSAALNLSLHLAEEVLAP